MKSMADSSLTKRTWKGNSRTGIEILKTKERQEARYRLNSQLSKRRIRSEESLAVCLLRLSPRETKSLKKKTESWSPRRSQSSPTTRISALWSTLANRRQCNTRSQAADCQARFRRSSRNSWAGSAEMIGCQSSRSLPVWTVATLVS